MASPPDVQGDAAKPTPAFSARRAQLLRRSAIVSMVLLAVATMFWDRNAKLMAFPLFAVVALVGSLLLYRHYRVIRDTPTSMIASAAPGYVELVGRAALLPGKPLVSLGGKPCCWYSVQEFTRVLPTTSWFRHDRRSSTEPFLVADDTGACLILPDGSGNFLTEHEARGGGENRRYHEWLLLPGDRVYAAGELTTMKEAAPELIGEITREDIEAVVADRKEEHDRELANRRAAEEHAAVGALVADWKADSGSLHERFDVDLDGTIDLKEWERARVEARREVRRRALPPRKASQREAGVFRAAELPVLRKPHDGRLFWIANELPDTLGTNVRFGAALMFLVFVYFACNLAWVAS